MKAIFQKVIFVFFLSSLIISKEPCEGVYVPSNLLNTSYSSCDQPIQNKPYLIDISKHENFVDFNEGVLNESNIPKEFYMPIKYIGYLTKEEYELCVKGCEQRTRALLMFIKDIYSGEKKVIKDGVIPKDVVDYALKAEGYEELIGVLPIENIAITNGADINLKRNSEGKMVVIEDNIGSLGGREDIYAIVDIYRKAFADTSICDPYKLQAKYVDQLKTWHSHMPGAYAIYCPDVMREEETFAPKEKNLTQVAAYLAVQNQLFVSNDRLFFSKNDSAEPIEISFLEHNGLDYTLDLTYQPFLDRCIKIKDDPNYYQGIPGSTNAVFSKNLILSHAPGTSIADSKIIYPFVEGFIRYYLHEEPLFASTRTYCLQKEKTPCFKMESLSFEESLARKNDLVLKPITGECGNGVVVGKKVTEEKWHKSVLEAHTSHPENFLFFEYSEVLEENNYLLIHRVFVDAFRDHVATRPGAYLRIKELNGDGVISTGAPGTLSTATLIEDVNINSTALEE